jgi:hypothetical protein
MVTPWATASSRACQAGRPRLLAPSPETSITRRGAWKGAAVRRRMEWSIAPLIEVPPPNSMRGARSMRAAKASASAALPMRVHDTAGAWRRGPVHWNMVTAMAWVGPEAMALCRRGLRKASA